MEKTLQWCIPQRNKTVRLRLNHNQKVKGAAGGWGGPAILSVLIGNFLTGYRNYTYCNLRYWILKFRNN